MAVSREDAATYVRQVMTAFGKDPSVLNEHERRLAKKYKESSQRVEAIAQDADALRNQIGQGQARLRSIELTLEGEQGKINGFLDYLVELKFGEGAPVPQVPEVPDAAVVTAAQKLGKGPRARSKTNGKSHQA